MNKAPKSPCATMQQQMSERIYANDTLNASGDLGDWRCTSRIPEALALSIYQQNLHGGIAQHLHTHFPVASAYLGTQGYRSICAEYLKSSPPDQPLFTLYAAHFPGFLLEYGERNPQQAIWSVVAHLAQIDFFHHNTFCANQQIEVEAQYHQLWLTLKTTMESAEAVPAEGLYQQPDLHPEHYQQTGALLTLVTFWEGGVLYFRPI